MRLRNESSYPTDEVRSIVRFACQELEPATRKKLYAEVVDAKKYVSGNASDLWKHALYDREWRRIPRAMRYRILSRIPKPYFFPRQFKEHGVSVWWMNWREALVWVTAHEAKHIEHFSLGRDNGYAGEAACDAYAAHMLERYKEER